MGFPAPGGVPLHELAAWRDYRQANPPLPPPSLPGVPLETPPTDDSSREWGTELGLASLALIWGVNFPLIKVALEDFHPLAFNALRFPLAAVVLLALVSVMGGIRRPDPGDRWRLVALGFLGNVGYQLLFILGLARTSAGNASLLLATTPAWTALLSTGVGQERLSRRVWLGVAGAVGGMILVVAGGEGFSFSGTTVLGDLLMVAAAMTWATYTVGARPLIQRYGAMPVTAWTLWAGTPALVLMGIPALAASDLGSVRPVSWGAMAYAGILAISVAYVLWNRGVRKLGNARTAIYSNTVPLVALAAAWVTLGEVPTALQLAGAAVILGGLTLARTGRGAAAR